MVILGILDIDTSKFNIVQNHSYQEAIQTFLGGSSTLLQPVTLVDSYSLKKLMFKLPVGYDFTILHSRDRWQNINCAVLKLADTRSSEIQKCEGLLILSNWTVSPEVLLK